MKPISISAFVLVFISSTAMSAPALNLNSPASKDGWLIAPPGGAYSQSLEIGFQASDTTGGATADIIRAGVMNDGACQSLQLFGAVNLPKGVISGNGETSYIVFNPNTPPNPSPTYLTKTVFPVSVSKAASSPVLTLCAYNPRTQGLTTLPLKISYGQPAKRVLISKATYSNVNESLTVKGSAVPNGRNVLSGSTVTITDINGNLLGSGSLNKNQFNVLLSVKGNPGQVKAQVVNTVSNTKPVTIGK